MAVKRSAEDDNKLEVKKALRTAIWVKQQTPHGYETKTIPASKAANELPKTQLSKDEDKDEDEDKFESDSTNSSEVSKNITELRETLAVRRERNRIAAQRCRQKKRERIENLETTCDALETQIESLEREISDLNEQKKRLEQMLDTHTCVQEIGQVQIDNDLHQDEIEATSIQSTLASKYNTPISE